MHKSTLIGIAVLALLGSIGTADADTADQVSLNRTEQSIIAVGASALAQSAPADFHPSIGAIVPHSLRLYAFGINVEGVVPAVKQYDYVKLPNQDILLVDPRSRKVVAMVEQKNAGGGK